MYKTKKPIFLLGFSRGGTNILLNLILSHPTVSTITGEIQEVFKSKKTDTLLQKLIKKTYYMPLCFIEKMDIFSIHCWNEREHISNISKFILDQKLYHLRFQAKKPTENLYKTEHTFYSKEELKNTRVISKLLNGNIFLVDILNRMYPDAHFISIVRNGYALCESHMRRGENFETFAKNYDLGCKKLRYYNDHMENFFTIRYEDIMKNSFKSLEKIYSFLKLDLKTLEKVRLVSKKIIDKKGQHVFPSNITKEKVIWYDKKSFNSHFITKTNKNQIDRLNKSDKELITEICKDSLKYFHYV